MQKHRHSFIIYKNLYWRAALALHKVNADHKLNTIYEMKISAHDAKITSLCKHVIAQLAF